MKAESGSRDKNTLSLTSTIDVSGCQDQAPTALLHPIKTRWPYYRKLFRAPGSSGQWARYHIQQIQCKVIP